MSTIVKDPGNVAARPNIEALCKKLEGETVHLMELVSGVRQGGDVQAASSSRLIAQSGAVTGAAVELASTVMLDGAAFALQMSNHTVLMQSQKNETLTQRIAELELAVIAARKGAQ